MLQNIFSALIPFNNGILYLPESILAMVSYQRFEGDVKLKLLIDPNREKLVNSNNLTLLKCSLEGNICPVST